MNYVGKFDATISSDGPGAHSPTYVQVDHLPAHAPAGAILVPDAQLLFNGDFKRSGVDLILSKDDREFVLHDYFKGEKRAALASPDGAHLTGDLVNALTGEVQYSQAGGPTNDHQVIGHVSKLQGSATAIRNGVSIILNNGDNVEKGDVVQSGSDSTLGVTFIDGTVFGLSSNARMVLNEMVYDPNGSNNSSLLSLVAGTITFVAGETAKHGDMKIDTPVATMGIRGTAVLVEIDFTVPGQGGTPDAKFQVLVEPDGTTGSYILFDKTTLQPIAMVNLAGQQINISNGVVSESSTPLSPDIQKLITDVFSLKFSDANPNTKTTTAQTDTLNPELIGPGFKLASGLTATPIFLVVNPGGGNSQTSPDLNVGPSLEHVPGPPLVVPLDAFGHPTTKFGLTELPGKTGDATDLDTVIGKINFVDVNAGDKPTVKVDFSSFVYQNAQHQNLTLNALQQQDIAATEIKLVVVPDPGNNNNGNATWTYSIPDNAFDFLAAGETLTLTYNVRVDNNFAPHDEFTIIPITITITGTNDAPVITSSAPTIAFAGGTKVSGGNLPLLDPDPVTGTKDPTSGTLSFKDVDLTDTHTVSAALTGAVGVLNGVTVLNGIDELPPGPFDLLKAALTASIGTDSTGTGVGTINWNLANLPVYIADFIPTGEKLTLTYTVTLTDSQGATTTQDVTVTIGGTNAPAVVWIDTTASPSGGQWNVGTNWETGLVPIATDDVIIITDQLIGLTPVYPVTIDSDIAAVANSLTMNDFGPLFTNSPKLVNQGTLTVGLGGISLKADSIIENDKLATISVAGLMEVLEQSSLQNYGKITIHGGGDFKDQSTITNFASGTIEVSGGTLDVLVDIANSGSIAVDSGATLALSAAAIDGGTVTINGTLELEGSAAVKNGSLGNSGQIKVSGTGNALDGETVTNNGAGAIDISGALTLLNNTSISNAASSNAETVEIGASLTLQDTSFISGGAVTNKGTLNLQATSALKSGTLTNTGQVNISGTGNTLDSETVTNNGTAGVIDITGALTLEHATSITNGLTNAETVDSTGSLTLQDTSFIGGGAVINKGTLNLQATSALKSGTLTNTGAVNISGTGNTLDGETVTNNGTAGVIDITGALTLEHAASITNGLTNAETVDSTGSLTLQDTSFISGGTVTIVGTLDLEGTSFLQNGILTNTGQVNVSGSDNTFDGETVTNSGAGVIDITGALTLLDNASISNGASNNAETVVHGASLTLKDTSSITGGKLTNAGDVYIEASTGATLDGVSVDNTHGTIHVDADVGPPPPTPATLILDNGTTITGGIVDVGSAGTLDLENATIYGGTLSGAGTITAATGNGGSTLDGVTVNSGTTVTAAAGKLDLTGTITNHGEIDATTGVLDLVYAIINGGLLGGSGTVDVVSASKIAGNATLNSSTVTVDDKLTLDDATVSGSTITDKFKIEFDDTVQLTGGATIQGQSGSALGAIVNLGTLEVAGAATLLDDTLTNTGHVVQVDDGQTLTLLGTEIIGGIVNDYNGSHGGTIHVTGASKIDGGATLNDGAVTVDAKLTLDDVTVSGSAITDKSSIEFDDTVKLTGGAKIQGQSSLLLGAITNLGTLEVAGAATLLDDTLTNTGHIVQVDDGRTLTLSGTEIIGGTVNDYNGSHGGTIHVTGASKIDGGATLNNGAVTVDAKLTLDDVTVSGSTITDNFNIEIDDTVKLTDGATIQGQSSLLLGAIVNLGTLEVAGAATLLDDTLTNTGHVVQVDSGQTLDLDGSTINGGTLTLLGTLDSSGASFITGASIDNTDNIDVTSGTLTIDPALVTNTGTIRVMDGSTLVVNGETVANSGTASHTHAVTNGTIQVDADGSTLDLEGSTIDGGIVEISGILNSTGTSAIEDASISNTGTIESTSGLLTIDPALPVTLTNSGTLESNGGELDITGEPVTNTGTLQAIDHSTLKLTSLTVDNTSGTVTVASGSMLDLAGVTIDGGTIIDNGIIDVTGSSAIDGTVSLAHGHITTTDAILNDGTVTVEHGVTLTLDDVAVTGTTFNVESGGTIQLDGGTTLTLSDAIIDGGTTNDYSSAFFGLFIVDANIDVIGHSAIDNASLNNGNVTVENGVMLTLDNDTVTGTSFTDAASGIVQIGGDTTLTLSQVAINGGIVDTASGSVIQVDSGTTELSGGSITNDGTLEVIGAGSKLIIDDQVTGTGSLNISGAATLEFVGLDNGEGVTFAPGSHGTLEIDTAIASHASLTFGGEIYGVGEDNSIDLADLQYSRGDISLKTSVSNGVTTVTVTDTHTHQSVVLDVAGQHSDWDVTSDGHGGVEISDPPADSASMSVDSGATLDLGAASAATVSFLNTSGSTGTLALDQPSSFTGLISGFTGDGTLAGSDQIDLKGINYNSNSFSQSYNATTDTLSLSDGTNSSILHFVGTYQAANFSFASDGNGGTIVYDPPVPSGQAVAGSVARDPGPAPSQTIVASAPNQTLTGLAASDNFVFNFANVGHGAVTNFHPATDTLQFASPIFANAQAVLNATHDDGLGNTVVTLDGHDTVTLSGVVKAQLHVTDFHVV